VPQPKSVEQLAADLLALYATSWERIQEAEQRILNDWTGLRRTERLARLRALQVTVERLMDTADEQALRFAQQDVPQAYLLGSAAAGVGVPAAWEGPDLDAIGVLVNDTYSSLLDATTFVRESTKTLIRTLAREHVADKLVRGETAEQAGRDLAASLEGRGVAAVVYKDGSRHGLADYANMLARTKTAEAYSTATLNQLDRAGITFAECFDNPRCGLDGHDDPDKPNGRVFPMRTAQQFVISHPRCVRSWGGRPDVTSARQAARASGSATAAQNADQADVAVSRQEAAIQRAFARRGTVLTDSGQRVRSPAHAAVLSRRQARLAARSAKVRG
jgi:hypothetical protein